MYVTFSPSLSTAYFLSVSRFLSSRMTDSRMSSGQSSGHNTYAPKMVLYTVLF